MFEWCYTLADSIGLIPYMCLGIVVSSLLNGWLSWTGRAQKVKKVIAAEKLKQIDAQNVTEDEKLEMASAVFHEEHYHALALVVPVTLKILFLLIYLPVLLSPGHLYDMNPQQPAAFLWSSSLFGKASLTSALIGCLAVQMDSLIFSAGKYRGKAGKDLLQLLLRETVSVFLMFFIQITLLSEVLCLYYALRTGVSILLKLPLRHFWQLKYGQKAKEAEGYVSDIQKAENRS